MWLSPPAKHGSVSYGDAAAREPTILAARAQPSAIRAPQLSIQQLSFLPPRLIRLALKHRLNISRIAELALNSIIDHLEAVNQTESSKFLGRGSLQKESRRASVAQWLEQQPCKL